MSFSELDYQYMRRALELAALGRYTTSPNPNVGAVVVNDGQVVGEGYHRQAGGPHAEVFALRQAGALAQGATCYVTLEPCSHYGRTPPCALALITAGVKRVVVAMLDPNPLVAGLGIKLLQDAGIVVECGLLQTEAIALNPGFLHKMQSQRPFVRLKLAASVIDNRKVDALLKINADLGRLGGLIKLWLTNDKRTRLIGKSQLHLTLESIRNTQSTMLDVIMRLKK